MVVDKKRAFVYFLLFTLLLVSMMDRINMSVAGGSIAKEMGLTPTSLGYLFSSFLWIYVICLLPFGIITDRLGSRVTIAAAMGLWSISQMCSGLAPGLSTLILARLGLGAFESAVNPCANRVIREWAPRSERALAAAIWNSGALAGPAFGALLVAWLVSDFGWRPSFIITGILGLVWMAIWLLVFRLPEDTKWLSNAERARILAERDIGTPNHAAAAASIGYRGLLATPTMWGLAFTMGSLTYVSYFFLTWLPGYMQMSRGLSIMGSGIYTALPYALAIVFCIFFSHICDRLLDPDKLRSGNRRNAVAAGSMITAVVVLLTPFASSMGMVVVLLTIALTFVVASQAWCFALLNDILRADGDVGRAFAFLTLGGNVFGILAPIVTGYLVSSTGSFTIPFIVCGSFAVLGALSALFVVRGTIGDTRSASVEGQPLGVASPMIRR